MSVLGGQDLRQLRELLARSNPEVILPSSGKGPLSQAVVLTLIHRVGPFPPITLLVSHPCRSLLA